MNVHTKTFQYGPHTVTLETGRMARQADGAVLVSMGDTSVLVTAVGRIAQVAVDLAQLHHAYQCPCVIRVGEHVSQRFTVNIFHLVLQGMGQCCLCQITRVVGALEHPVTETRTEPMGHAHAASVISEIHTPCKSCQSHV